MRQQFASCTLLCLAACSGAQSEADDQPVRVAQTRPAAQSSGAQEMQAEAPLAPLVIPRKTLDRVLARGPGDLLQHVPIEPAFDSKHKFVGFRLVEIYGNDPKILRFGVLPGDLLLAVNGQRIVTPGDLMAAFAVVKTADMLDIDVRRDGQLRSLHFPIVPAAVAP